ncbi:hypothetical protein ACAF76_015045 [Brevibacillus sp. TJ4]|uniref:hypothetical protein n=1 Tax=Brevibacillus sp. TJ4 TaxID=3234853 RepID=UPI0037D891F5
MQTKRNIALILFAILIVGGIAYAAVGLIPGWGGVKLAEGYLYETEETLVYLKTEQASEQEVKVEVTLLARETKGGIPVLNSTTASYPATLGEEGELLLDLGEMEELWTARVEGSELVTSAPLPGVLPQETRLAAADLDVFQQKQQAWEAQIQQEAAAKREEQAIEKERVEKAQKTEKLARLKADLRENIEYLDGLDFSMEVSTDQENLASMQSILDEVNMYAGQSSMHRTEYEVMAATVDSMKVLRDGIGTLAESIERKKQNIDNLISILEADKADLLTTWEEIKGDLPDADKQLQELHQVIEQTEQAIAKAKERVEASAGAQTDSRQQADRLYQQAVTAVNQVKEKFGF